MRLFVAAHLSGATREALRASQASLTSAAAHARVPPRIRMVNPDVAHVTVRFIGDVPDADAASLQSALAEPLDVPAFDTVWSTIGVFPPGRAGERSPRTIWLGVSAGSEEMRTLAALVDQRVEPIAGPGETRAFTAHLTIGRVKDPGRGMDWPAAVAAATPAPTRSRIDRVTLYRSQLSPRGPTYTALCETRLGG